MEVPLTPALPGGFGAVRKYDIHTGVDLYTPERSFVFAMEEGVVVAIEDFTGEKAGSPWWNNTKAVLIEGETGVILYGELETALKVGSKVTLEGIVGRVVRVLQKDKGAPMSMLHLEQYVRGTRESVVWRLNAPQPEGLVNPTPMLLTAYEEELKNE